MSGDVKGATGFGKKRVYGKWRIMTDETGSGSLYPCQQYDLSKRNAPYQQNRTNNNKNSSVITRVIATIRTCLPTTDSQACRVLYGSSRGATQVASEVRRLEAMTKHQTPTSQSMANHPAQYKCM